MESPIAKAFLASGGITFAGDGTTSFQSQGAVFPYVGTGGMQFGGAAETNPCRVYSYIGLGGFAGAGVSRPKAQKFRGSLFG